MSARYMVCGIAVFVFLSGCAKGTRQPKARKGVLDLSTWNFERDGIARLDGEWEFYYSRLFTPGDFSDEKHMNDTATYLMVPGFWNVSKNDGIKYPTYGYATYRLRVMLDSANEARYIHILDPNSAYKLWINGELIAAEGTVGRNKQQERPRLQPVLKIFNNARYLEIVVQVSNFFNHKPGIWQNISIGNENQMLHERDLSFILSMCLVGTFLILAVYNLFIFFLRRNELSALWFSCLALGFGIRTFVIGDRPVLSLLPGLGADAMYRIQYESFLGACFFLVMFVYSLFRKEFSNLVMELV